MGRSVGNAHTEINGGQLQTADPEGKIRVLIVNRSPLMATALATLFSSNSDFEVVGQAKCCADCCSGVANLAPDVIVCDLQSEDKVGAWSLDRFRNCLPDVPTIVLSDDDHEQRILRVVRVGVQGFLTKDAPPAKLFDAIRTVGVQGFLTKDAPPAKLFDAIRTVSKGGCYLEGGIQSKILGLLGKRNGNSDPYCALLNPRERHILQLYHNSAIFRKLGVSSRAEAVKVATEQALIG
jgi:DNA-binding NarL/FixJ family response regulator